MQTGSWFELANKNAIFGVLGPNNPLWSIILGFFGVSGYPTAGDGSHVGCMTILSSCQLLESGVISTFARSNAAGFLFYKAIQSANKDFERADKADGY